MTLRILTLSVKTETDVVGARQRARHIAGFCGFSAQDQVRIATAVSELARNVYNYAGSGRIEFSVDDQPAPQHLIIRITDRGPGIANLDLILSGDYHSQTGMGMGIIGSRRLMDDFDIRTGPGQGTDIRLAKHLPRDALRLNLKHIGELDDKLASMPSGASLDEVQQQNQELLGALAELTTRQQELLTLTRELEDTNLGMLALHAELDEKADRLRRTDETKSRFLSNMSHEFRTPLSSIRALAKLLLDRTDGDLTDEQHKQVAFILQSALGLNELVNDLLDLTKIESGKIDVRPLDFEVADTFSALRGMMRPLIGNKKLLLTFDAPASGGRMFTDETKLAQILRNFISNAVKFTEAGTITVSATPLDDAMQFTVKDTGLGIAAADLQLIFEEFSQVENHLQVGLKGTGLGLALCRTLSALLNGHVTVASTLGAGSVFSAVIPIVYLSPVAATVGLPFEVGPSRPSACNNLTLD